MGNISWLHPSRRGHEPAPQDEAEEELIDALS
jgi:hypothetical protein